MTPKNNRRAETSTPKEAKNIAKQRETHSISSIESVEDKLESIPSDSSLLVSLNAAIDATQQNSTQQSSNSISSTGLSNSSEFDLLVSATTAAEAEHAMREGYRTAHPITDTSCETSSNLSASTRSSPVEQNNGNKRRLNIEDTPSKLCRLDFQRVSLMEFVNFGVGVSPRGPGPAPPALVSGGCPDINSGVGVSPRRVGTAPTMPTVELPTSSQAISSERDPLTQTPATNTLTNILDIETPSPYAILPTPESILGLDNSLTQNVPSSIGTETSWSPANTPFNLGNSVQRSRKNKSTKKRSTTLNSRSRHSRTPFDRSQPRSQPMSPMLVQALNPSLPSGIVRLNQDSGSEANQED